MNEYINIIIHDVSDVRIKQCRNSLTLVNYL